MAATIESVAGDLPGAVRPFRCGFCPRADGWLPAGEAESRGWAVLVFTHMGRVMGCTECIERWRKRQVPPLTKPRS